MSLENLVKAVRLAVTKQELFKQAANMVATLLTSEHVSEDELRRRYEICAGCEFSELTSQGDAYCGKCGCSVVQDRDKLLNKLRYRKMADGSSVCPENKF